MSNPFDGTEAIVNDLYELLLAKVKEIGVFSVETKRTSIHLSKRAAFLGVHPKKKYLEINIVSRDPLGDRYKSEQVSKNRFHNRVRINSATDFDRELMRDIENAYKLLS